MSCGGTLEPVRELDQRLVINLTRISQVDMGGELVLDQMSSSPNTVEADKDEQPHQACCQDLLE